MNRATYPIGPEAITPVTNSRNRRFAAQPPQLRQQLALVKARPQSPDLSGTKKRRFGQQFAKEVGMGDPAEENDPPPESPTVFAEPRPGVNKKCDERVTKSDKTSRRGGPGGNYSPAEQLPLRLAGPPE